MFGKFLSALALKSAARKYARYLGAQLHKDYGSSEQYSRAQIDASAGRAQLPIAYLRLGYAAFLTEAAFAELSPAGSLSGYDDLRALLRRYPRNNHAAGGFEPAGENSYAVGSAGGLSDGHH